MLRLTMVLALVLLMLLVAACRSDSDGASDEVLYIGGIPDQEAARLVRRFDSASQYLSQQLGVTVEYVPTVDYAALVTAFRRGDIDMAWFGGLTGVQARTMTPGAQAILQRPSDREFHSVFIVQSSVAAQSLAGLKGLSFAFGSESSTSGHLMPRFFLTEAGVDPEADFNGLPIYSGSHDQTWKLVESGVAQAGALNEDVWANAVESGSVNLTKVRLLETTPPYYDYHWTIRPDADEKFGAGFTQRVIDAFLALGPNQQEILDLFDTDSFIETENGNYQAIEEVARGLGLIE